MSDLGPMLTITVAKSIKAFISNIALLVGSNDILFQALIQHIE